MATITITITESPLQLLDGIPSYITLETNVPSTIFYTLDGTTPTTESMVVVGPITLPVHTTYVVLKAFATDGVDTCPVITQEFKTVVTGARNSHDTVIIQDTGCAKASYPFGDSTCSGNESIIFQNTGGVIVDNNQPTRQPDGYDGTAVLDADGYILTPSKGTGYFTPPSSQYLTLFSETDSIGQTGRGIGTLPAKVLYSIPRNDNNHPQSSNVASALFNPRALVIFQDSSQTPYDEFVPKINRPYFDLEDPAIARDGSLLTNTETVSPQGGFIKAQYNPRNNIMTYYYYDNRVARWIISSEPYSYTQNPTRNMAGMVTRSGREKGANFVYQWNPFKYRHLI